MVGICPMLVVGLLFGQMSITVPVLRLQGLDRTYFQHVGNAGDRSAIPPVVSALLPDVVQPANSVGKTAAERRVDEEKDLEVVVRDFPLPLEGSPKKLFLRQVVVYEDTSRITKLWWTLYDEGRRSDIWQFGVNPEQSDDKVLSNYEIESVSVTGRDSLELRISGIMFRPQGAFWITGKTFGLSLLGDTLMLSRVRNAFGFFQGYATGRRRASIEVSTERETGGRFQTRSYNSVPDRVLRHCQFQNPQNSNSDSVWEFDWGLLERSALCVTQGTSVRTSYRGLDEPSFVERGGKADD